MPALPDARLVVVTGKGGTGKTTVAAALALLGVRGGRRTALVEVAGRGDAAALLAGAAVEHVSVTPRAAMEEYLRDQLPRPAAELLARSGTFSALVSATPGMGELLTAGKVWELAADSRRTPGARPFDLVVLDAPASGHGLALLGAPRTFAGAARVGPIHRQAATIDADLRNPARTAVVAVATPEEMPVNETLELRAALRERLGIELARVVVNGVLPDRLSAAEARELEALGAPPGGAVGAALWLHRSARAQRAQLRRLRAGLDAPPVRLPFVFRSEVGPAAVADLATVLGRAR